MPVTHLQRASYKQQAGFTAVVMAALFIAFAVIAAAAVERNTVIQQVTRRDATRDQLQKLANAIIEYSVFNRNGSGVNLYPCPADPTVAATAASFGSAVANCYTGTPPGGNANITVLGGGASDPIRGMVPVLELSAYGISINDAFDPWNDRIMYIVNRTQTVTSPTGSSTPSQTNNVTLSEKRTGFTIAPPDFILISYGRDRVGGIPRSGTTAPISCAAAETVARKENCDNDTTFYVAPTYIASGAETAATTTFLYNTYFDDILTWYRQ